MSSNIQEMRDAVRQLKEEVSELDYSFRDMERVALRTLTLMRRFSGDENVDRILEKATRLVIMLRMVQMAGHAATAAMGPWGILMSAAMGLSVAVVGADTLANTVATT